MADEKVSAKTLDTTPALTDETYEVKNPGTTPLSRRVLWSAILTLFRVTLDAAYLADIHGATGKTTPTGADEFPIADSAASFVQKKLSLTNLMAYIASLNYIALVPGSSGNVVTSNGSSWQGSPPSVSDTNTVTLTNKRITKRVATITQSATPTINTDNCDIAEITGLAAAITSLTTNLSGTPVKGDLLQMWITDDGTARTITPGASFAGSAEFPLTGLTTTISKRLMLLWEYTTIWTLVGKINQA